MMERYIKASGVKELVREYGFKLGTDAETGTTFLDALDAEIAITIKKSILRAQQNRRQTIFPRDL